MRVVSYNIHHGVGTDGRVDLERTAATLAATGADIVGLQEVDRHFGVRSGFVDQAGWLGAPRGRPGGAGPPLARAPPAAAGPRRQYGNAVLAVPEILGWRNILLPRPPATEQRGLLEALVLLDGVPVRFLVTHLQNRSQSARVAQADAIRAVVDGLPAPVVLTGDLNARAGSREVRRLTAVLDDAWAVAGRGRGGTFPATSPRTRIDYVLMSPDLRATAAVVVDSRASDHRPVRADLESAGRGDGG